LRGLGRLRSSPAKKNDVVDAVFTGFLTQSSIPGMIGSIPVAYMLDRNQYIAFTLGVATEPAEVVVLGLAQ
jgi:hypothetical protein